MRQAAGNNVRDLFKAVHNYLNPPLYHSPIVRIKDLVPWPRRFSPLPIAARTSSYALGGRLLLGPARRSYSTRSSDEDISDEDLQHINFSHEAMVERLSQEHMPSVREVRTSSFLYLTGLTFM